MVPRLRDSRVMVSSCHGRVSRNLGTILKPITVVPSVVTRGFLFGQKTPSSSQHCSQFSESCSPLVAFPSEVSRHVGGPPPHISFCPFFSRPFFPLLPIFFPRSYHLSQSRVRGFGRVRWFLTLARMRPDRFEKTF